MYACFLEGLQEAWDTGERLCVREVFALEGGGLGDVVGAGHGEAGPSVEDVVGLVVLDSDGDLGGGRIQVRVWLFFGWGEGGGGSLRRGRVGLGVGLLCSRGGRAGCEMRGRCL